MKIICVLLFLGFSVAGYSQDITMKELFRVMPDSVLPLLTTNNRLDFIDYLDNNMAARVRNRFDEVAEMTVLDANYLHIQMTSVSEVEMRLFHLADTVVPLVCLLRSYKAPARETVVEFYDSKWNRQYWVDVPSPSVADFFSSVPDSLQSEREQAIAELSDMPLWSVSTSREYEELTFDLQTEVLPKELRQKMALYVSSLRYQWNGVSFDLARP